MLYASSKVIVEKIINESDRKLNFPPIKNVDSLKTGLYQLICGYIAECVYSDFLEYQDTEEKYVDGVVNSGNYPVRLFSKFPVLHTIVKRAVNNYISYANQIYNTYVDEQAQIASVWNFDMGQIEEMSIGRGDTHSGKSVAILKMTNGRLVFKPHSLDADIFFYELLSVFSKNLSADIFMPKMLSSKDHSWQEYIEYRECSCNDEAARLFYRLGIYQWVFYMLSSVDMHYENLICHGAHPVFIDLETLISGSISSLEYCEARSLQASVLMTGLLPGLKGTQNVIDMNLSALFTGCSKSRKHFVNAIRKNADNQWEMTKIPAVTAPTHNIVKINGVEVLPHEYEAFFIDGFRDSAKIFINRRAELLCLIDNLNNTSIRLRKILRPTIVYGKFLTSALRPQNLYSVDRYCSIFEILRKNFTIGAFGYLRVNYEIEELKKGNIPSFEIYSNSKHLYVDGDVLCEEYLYETPYSLVRRRCLEIDNSLIEYQVRLIKMAFVSKDTPDDLIYSIKRGTVKNNSEAFIHCCAEELKKSLIPAPGGGYAMISLHTCADDESFVIHTGDSELYHFGGAIWFLYAYGKKYNPAYIEYATGLLSLLISKYEYDCTTERAKNYSVYSGFGALTYIAYNIFSDSGNQQLKDVCIRIIKNGFNQITETGIRYDFVGGDLSFIYLACNIIANEPDMREMFSNSVEKIKKMIILDQHSFLNNGLAHGAAGLLITLSAINLVSDGCKQTLNTLINMLLSSYEENESNAWCKGKTGIALALDRAGVPLSTIPYPLLTKEYIIGAKNLCLCHGLFGEIDVALSLYPYQRSEIAESLSIFDFDTLQVLRDSDYFYESFMLGNTGIAYTLLRLNEPTLPSLLSLDLFRRKK